MQINLITVGKLKEKWLRDAYAEYEKRLTRYCKLSLTELPESRLPESPSDAEIAAALQQEGKAILNACRGKIIALCIEGKQYASEEFAALLSQYASYGDSTVSFVIGSSFGLSDDVLRTRSPACFWPSRSTAHFRSPPAGSIINKGEALCSSIHPAIRRSRRCS